MPAEPLLYISNVVSVCPKVGAFGMMVQSVKSEMLWKRKAACFWKTSIEHWGRWQSERWKAVPCANNMHYILVNFGYGTHCTEFHCTVLSHQEHVMQLSALIKKNKQTNTKQPTQQSKQKTPKGPLLTWGFGARGTWFVLLSWPVIDVDATGNRFHLRSLWFPRDASWHCEKAVRPRIKSWVIQCLLLWFLRVQIHWHTSCWQRKLSANFLFSGGGWDIESSLIWFRGQSQQQRI